MTVREPAKQIRAPSASEGFLNPALALGARISTAFSPAVIYYWEHYVLNIMNAVRGAYLGRTTMIMFNVYRSE